MAQQIPLFSGRILDFTNGPLVMGVINCTPDSFYASSRAEETSQAVRVARNMISEGASILDIGGESTRPGSDPVNVDVEKSRVVPVISAIRDVSDVPISIDTRKAAVAKAALEAGADIINDVSALRDDSDMLSLAVESGAPVVLMHMLGDPKTMQNRPSYSDAVREILHFLITRANEVIRAGIDGSKIILDPGIGFGKRLEDNLRLIADLPAFAAPGYPVLVGASRKSFIAHVLRRYTDAEHADSPSAAEVPPERRLAGSLAVHVVAALKGASILRVHDVGETTDAVRMVRAITTVARTTIKGEA